jgi:hypothetical protein
MVTNALTWIYHRMKTSIFFQNIKGQKHVLDLPEFYDGNKKAGSFP